MTGGSERVVSVNIGGLTGVPYRGKTVRTGIFKAPVEGPVHVGPTGLEGDSVADLRVHGGVDKAVYLYSAESYAWWRRELGHGVEHAEFGENLTVAGPGLTDEAVRIGDRLRAGGALLEVSVPREPCFKLGIRMGTQAFVPRFRDAGRVGYYARVLEPGPVRAGDPVVVETAAPAGSPTVAEVHRAFVSGRSDAALMRRMAAVEALAADWRDWMTARAEEAEAAR